VVVDRLDPLGFLGSLALFRGGPWSWWHKVLVLGDNLVKREVVVRAEFGQDTEVDGVELAAEDDIHGVLVFTLSDQKAWVCWNTFCVVQGF